MMEANEVKVAKKKVLAVYPNWYVDLSPIWRWRVFSEPVGHPYKTIVIGKGATENLAILDAASRLPSAPMREEEAGSIPEVCGSAKAPVGWSCTRAYGHDGPCAADRVPTDADEPPTCFRCESEYNLRDGCEPSKYCDNCAQDVVTEYEARVPTPSAPTLADDIADEMLTNLRVKVGADKERRAPTLEGAGRWTDEAMRFLDLCMRGFRPDLARELVEKYRNLPENIGRDIFDANPAYTDEQLLEVAGEKLPELNSLIVGPISTESALLCRERQLRTALTERNAALKENADKDDHLARWVQRANDLEQRVRKAEMSISDERMELQTIDERDAAEDALGQAYLLITGNIAEWSNMFGYSEALSEIESERNAAVSRAEKAEGLLADVSHLWLDGYIEKNPNSFADESVSKVTFEEIERFLRTQGISVDYCGWERR